MSKDVAARLDALAHDYREGRLSMAAYRNLRAPLLDLLVSQPGADGADRSLTTQRGRVVRARRAVREDFLPRDAQPARRGLRVGGGLAVAAVMAIAAVTVYSRVRDVNAPAPVSHAQLDTARKTSQTLGDSDDWSGARLHSLLAEFDGRAVCRKELAGSPEPFCRDLLATADAGPQLLVLTASSGKSAGARSLFAISLHEVSQAQFRRYCEHTASRCPRRPGAQDDDPVVNVTWDEARQYLLWLSEMSGQTYRLPTEAEWQQAAHDGKKSGWRAGRVREWTQDANSASRQRTVRGVAPGEDAATLLSARSGQDQTARDDLRGFRAVRELQ